MTTDNKDNKLSIGSSDYAEILRHAVAVIEHARTEIARHVNGYVSTAYWEIGQMLHAIVWSRAEIGGLYAES